MRAEDCGTLIWPFEHLDAYCQVGTNIAPESSIYIIGVGRKANETHQTIVVSRIDYTNGYDGGNLRMEKLSKGSNIFKDAGIHDPITQLIFC